MMPTLYEKQHFTFTTAGICKLHDCISCVVTEGRNSVYECDFEYPVNGDNFDEIKIGRTIVVRHDDTSDLQPFDIVSYSKPINGIVSFHAVHISYRLSRVVASITDTSGISGAFEQFATKSKPGAAGFNYWTDIESGTAFPLADGIPRSVREMLGGTEGSILDTYGGEYEWDGNTVKLWQHRGEATQFSIRYGVNMTDYKDETDASECYSAIVPYYVKEDNNEMTIVQGNMVSLGLPTPLGTNYAVVAVDFSDQFQDGVPTMGQLENLARQKLWDDSPVLPNRNIEVKFVRLQDTGEYDEYEDLLKCRLCDTVKVEFPQYKTAARFKIVKIVFDVLQERYTEMELGTLSTTLAEALGVSQFGSDNKPTAGQSASYSGNVLRFGNLRIYTGKVNTANTGRATITFPTGTFSQVITAIPYCGQGGFGGYDTTSVTELTTSKVTLYQYNSAGAAMDVGVVVIGLA